MSTETNNSSISLRAAKTTDSDFAYLVKKDALGSYVRQTWGCWDEDWQRDFHRRDWNFAVTNIVIVDNVEIGTLGLRRTETVLWLENLHLLPEYHNKGIGSRLIQRVIDDADAQNVTVRLRVLKVNPAVRLYSRFGFKTVEEHETHLIMERVVE